MTQAKTPRTRSPRGVLSDKPVCVRLLPAERQKLERLAMKENRSVSSLARLILLEGLAVYESRSTRAS
ncbi:hypothetical protein [Cupriavidus metallidurans]|uniref:hypothetical protein n=1 Tax=Cupriavidus metallidurans TaxID=119219 RepID=UPI001CCC0329|nr:hypothetical protein [Cupriavidus metallidurans]UBM11714.1 hypothetical protein LAI70_15350 [Cupriavidus metallidurans]